MSDPIVVDENTSWDMINKYNQGIHEPKLGMEFPFSVFFSAARMQTLLRLLSENKGYTISFCDQIAVTFKPIPANPGSYSVSVRWLFTKGVPQDKKMEKERVLPSHKLEDKEANVAKVRAGKSRGKFILGEDEVDEDE